MYPVSSILYPLSPILYAVSLHVQCAVCPVYCINMCAVCRILYLKRSKIYPVSSLQIMFVQNCILYPLLLYPMYSVLYPSKEWILILLMFVLSHYYHFVSFYYPKIWWYLKLLIWKEGEGGQIVLSNLISIMGWYIFKWRKVVFKIFKSQNSNVEIYRLIYFYPVLVIAFTNITLIGGSIIYPQI